MINPALHSLMLLFTLLVIVVIQILGYSASRHNRVNQLSHRLGYGMLILYIIYLAYFLAPSNFSWGISLPLQVCDLLIPVSAIALISSQRDARSIQYFCGFILAGQAIVTPAGDQNPQSFRFWLYWIIHAGIYSSAIFDLIVMKYTPYFRDICRVFLFNIIYISIVFPLNILFNWNYGFLGASKPEASTIIDIMGPWPQRVPLMIALAFLSQALMLVPWSMHRIITKKFTVTGGHSE
jgi:hypothetical integral membrane protein (TIGR02206 family)